MQGRRRIFMLPHLHMIFFPHKCVWVCALWCTLSKDISVESERKRKLGLQQRKKKGCKQLIKIYLNIFVICMCKSWLIGFLFMHTCTTPHFHLPYCNNNSWRLNCCCCCLERKCINLHLNWHRNCFCCCCYCFMGVDINKKFLFFFFSTYLMTTTGNHVFSHHHHDCCNYQKL